MSLFGLFRSPLLAKPIPAIAVANSILDHAWAIGSPTNAPRLQRLAILCDHYSQEITGSRLIEEAISFAHDMPFFTGLHTAFRRWNADPITSWGHHPEIAVPFIVPIEGTRMKIIKTVVSSFAGLPTWNIPRKIPC